MANKPLPKLNPLDYALRSALPPEGGGDTPDRTQLRIEKFTGFELFNTRPYHNYETWSDGYRVTGSLPDQPEISLEREDLDDAVYAWIGVAHECKKGNHRLIGDRCLHCSAQADGEGEG